MVRIPAGATNIDIKQVSYSGKPEDDNYLGECACVGPDRLRAETYLLQPREFSSRRSMPLSPNMTVKHPDWEGVTLSPGGRLLVGEARGFGAGARAKSRSKCFHKGERKPPWRGVAASGRSGEGGSGLFTSFLWGVEGEF